MNRTTLYVSDMDQTLLQPDGTLSERSKAGLNRIYDAGVLFSVASARNVLSISSAMAGVRLHTPVIAANGAFVSDLDSGSVRTVVSLEPALAQELIHRSNPAWFDGLAAPPPFVSSYRAPAHRLYAPKPENGGMQWYADDRIAAADPRLQSARGPDGAELENGSEQVTSVTFIDRADVLTPLRDRLQEQLGESVAMNLFENQYSPGWWWLTVLDPFATKAHAIERVITMLDAPRRSREDYSVVAFGDSTNDIPMLKAADRAIAVDNAVAAVKELADEVIGVHHEDSVVRYVLEHEGLA